MLRFLLAGCLSLVAADALAVTLQFNATFSTNDPVKYPNPQLCAQAVVLTANPNNSAPGRKVWAAVGPNGCTWEVSCAEVKAGVYRWNASLDSGNVVCQGSVDNTTSPSGPPSVSGTHIGIPPASKSPIGCGPGTWTISP